MSPTVGGINQAIINTRRNPRGRVGYVGRSRARNGEASRHSRCTCPLRRRRSLLWAYPSHAGCASTRSFLAPPTPLTRQVISDVKEAERESFATASFVVFVPCAERCSCVCRNSSCEAATDGTALNRTPFNCATIGYGALPPSPFIHPSLPPLVTWPSPCSHKGNLLTLWF